VPAWDLLVRASHWAVAALVIFDWVRDDGDRLHRIAGYVAVGIILVRWLWATTPWSRSGIAALVPSPRATLHYTRELLRGQAPRHLHHDPLGLWMVWLLWSLVLLLGITGWLSRLDAFWGDERVQQVHAWLADGLMVAAAVHLIGVAVMSWHWRENLAIAMITGRKRGQGRTDKGLE